VLLLDMTDFQGYSGWREADDGTRTHDLLHGKQML
jgi:hypothetical protein